MTSRTYWIASILLTLSCSVSSQRLTVGAIGPESGRAYSTDGRVVAVERGGPEQAASYVQIVIVPDGKSPVRVELAPGWYLDKKGLRFSEQDRVQVVGRPEPRAGSTVVVARRVQKGDQVLDLRDEAGRPAWEPGR